MQKYVHIQGLRSMAPFPGGMLNRELYSILFSLRGSDGMHTEFKSKERYSCRIVNNTAETAEAKTAVVPPAGGTSAKFSVPGLQVIIREFFPPAGRNRPIQLCG